MTVQGTAPRQDLVLATAVSAVANGLAYTIAGALYWASTGMGPSVSALEGLILSWFGGFCAASVLVGLPFLIWRRNRGAAVGWVFGFAIIQACAICAGVVLGLLGYVNLPTG